MSQYEEMAIKMETSDLLAEVFGDVTGLITGLEELGHDIEGEEPSDASHPIVTSRFHTYALRRTPPNKFAQMAFKPPVIRIAYVWFSDTDRSEEVAVVMKMGDKTRLGNQWYPGVVQQLQNSLIPE